MFSPADQNDLKKSKAITEKDSTVAIQEEIETSSGDITAGGMKRKKRAGLRAFLHFQNVFERPFSSW